MENLYNRYGGDHLIPGNGQELKYCAQHAFSVQKSLFGAIVVIPYTR